MANVGQTRSKNLKLNIEQATRVKFIRAQRAHLDTLIEGPRGDAIKRLNSRKTMERIRETGFEGNGRIMLQAASNVGDDAFHKLLHEIEKRTVALERVILQAEAWADGALSVAWRELTDDELNDALSEEEDDGEWE